MLLVTLGYSADREGYTGADWASAVDQRQRLWASMRARA